MHNHTVITLDRGVLSFQVEGAIERDAWRRLIAAGVCWLRMRGCGSIVLPHPAPSG